MFPAACQDELRALDTQIRRASRDQIRSHRAAGRAIARIENAAVAQIRAIKRECMELYDRKETFFFLDPPYTSCDAGMYSAWTIVDVQHLRSRLENTKGSWLLTLNDDPAIRRIFGDCQITVVERAKGITQAKSKTYRELVIRPA